jgi:hypothetical protein
MVVVDRVLIASAEFVPRRALVSGVVAVPTRYRKPSGSLST